MESMVLWDLMPCISRKYEEYGVMGYDAMYCQTGTGISEKPAAFFFSTEQQAGQLKTICDIRNRRQEPGLFQ